jgi:hypothetical protein
MATPQLVGHPLVIPHLLKISGKAVSPIVLKTAPTIKVVRDAPLAAVDVLRGAIAGVTAKSDTNVIAVSHLFKISSKPVNVSASTVTADSNFLHCAWSPDNAAWVFWMGVEADLMPALTSPNSIVANLVNKHIWWRSMP